MADFYLASGSPRRRELLRQVGARFETLLLREAKPRGPDVPEIPQPGEAGPDYVLRVAVAKARMGQRMAHRRALPPRPVLAADTEVFLDGEILGKPHGTQDAAAMLRRLCGREHEVLTIVALARVADAAQAGEDGAEVATAPSLTRVRMRPLSEDEIRRYCATGEPLGKAGAYALQGIGGAFIEHIEGSSSGVVGLPLAQATRLLAQAGIEVP
jgi:septum formation protein